MTTLAKTYDPQAIERRWYDFWEQNGYFRPQGDGSPFCIMIPPPNVTGTLHMGHAFQDTIMDTLIRYHRMRGEQTLWQPGADHAGIATQMVVERQLAAEDVTRHELGRETFIDRVWQWKEESGNQISVQLRRLGASPDWSRERFTMDDGLSEAVVETFVQLYDEGLIYRGKRLVNWDPVLHTAVSDLEVESAEEQGHIWHVRYPLADIDDHVSVATTRPETMLGDTAVAVHPEDERYAHLIGHYVDLPLSDRKIPIVGDAYVDPEFGSGCLKITPAHDFNDYAVGERHGMEPINIFTSDAKVNEHAPAAYRGLDRFEARERVVADLEAAGLLDRVDDHKLMIPRGDRTGAVIEPYLTDQWFVHVKPLAEPAIEAVRDGRIDFVPGNWAKTYFNWMEEIQDWCISRQIWWGHRIPAWYDDDGHVYVARTEAEARDKYGLGADTALTRDDDVLDTWYSSALWPFSTLGWPEQTEALKTFYPTSVLVTGFDIIFFWVARMIMFGLKFMGDVPFHQVYIHGLVRDSEGQKMSKSKGNVLDPIDLIDGIDLESLVAKRTSGMMQPQKRDAIEKMTRSAFPEGIPSFGTDAVRFTFGALASTGRDIRFDLSRVEGYRNFCNKLWNASRYVLMNTEGEDTGADGGEVELTVADRWIISRLQRTERAAREHIESYRFDLMSQAVYEFTWDEYCDWYVELAKTVLTDDNAPAERKRGTRRTLVRVLEALLRLMHPLMPYITEELWQKVAPLAGQSGETISLAPWPEADEARIDATAEADIDWLQKVVLEVRRVRSEMNLKPGQRVPLAMTEGGPEDQRRMQSLDDAIRTLARVDSLQWVDDESAVSGNVTALVGELKLLIQLGGLIDRDAELARLDKQTGKLEQEIERVDKKLENANFVDRAPADVVQKERDKRAEMAHSLTELRAQRERIAEL